MQIPVRLSNSIRQQTYVEHKMEENLYFRDSSSATQSINPRPGEENKNNTKCFHNINISIQVHCIHRNSFNDQDSTAITDNMKNRNIQFI